MTNPTTRSKGDERLLTLANFLDALPSNSINMDGWMQTLMDGEYTEEIKKDGVDQGMTNGVFEYLDQYSFQLKPSIQPEALKECGFAACAVGWAGTIPAFIAEGFTMQTTWDEHDVELRIGSAPYPTYRGLEGSRAVESFFVLDPMRPIAGFYSEWSYLFGPGAYGDSTPEPSDVAERIREFVRQRNSVSEDERDYP